MLRQTVCKAHENAKIVVRLIRRVHSFGFERLKTVGTQTLRRGSVLQLSCGRCPEARQHG